MRVETYTDNTWPMKNIEDFFLNCWVGFGTRNEKRKTKQTPKQPKLINQVSNSKFQKLSRHQYVENITGA